MKLAICTPTSGFARIEYVESLTILIKSILRDPHNKIRDVKLFFFTSSVIPANRNKIVNHALRWGASHILFIDDDMRFPAEVFKPMWQNRKKYPIIAANCCKRQYPIRFMATDFLGKEIDSREKTGFEEVMFTGFSFALIDADVFRKVPKPWTAFPYMVEHDDYGTEDYYFFDQARLAGFPCVVDHDVSKLIQHVGAHAFDPLSERGMEIVQERTDDSTD